MKDTTLQHYRNLAALLAERKKIGITITFLSGNVQRTLQAKFDGMFSSVELGNATVPARELRHWLKVLYGADPRSVNVKY